jgi:uncharacterized protein YegP (UPF0339 family)
MAHFELFSDNAGLWRWRLKAGNGEIVASSENYVSENNARRGINDLCTALLFAIDQPTGLIHDPKIMKVPG